MGKLRKPLNDQDTPTPATRGKRARQAYSLEAIPDTFPKFGDIFQHYKGGFYTALGACHLEATGDLHVAYQCRKSNNIFVRPYREWKELVFVTETCRIPRFSRILPG